MKKKLFKNYSYEFDKNEAKVLTSFCKQAVNQMSGDDNFYKDVSAFQSISNKLNEDYADVKLTKDERTRLVRQLSENAKHLKKKLDNSWFIPKWFYKSMYNQYNNIILKHFSD